MEAVEAIYSQVRAAIVGDTGTGGLYNNSYAGRVRTILREGDSKEKSLTDRPRIIVRIRTLDISPFPIGAADDGTNEFFDAIVTFDIFDDRDDRAQWRINRTHHRLRKLLQNTELTSLVDSDEAGRKWYFSPLAALSNQAVPPTGKEVCVRASYRLHASKGTV